MIKNFLSGILFCFFTMPCFAFAEQAIEWTSLISADDFDGIRADVSTACVGIISILIIIVAVALLKRAFTS